MNNNIDIVVVFEIHSNTDQIVHSPAVILELLLQVSVETKMAEQLTEFGNQATIDVTTCDTKADAPVDVVNATSRTSE